MILLKLLMLILSLLKIRKFRYNMVAFLLLMPFLINYIPFPNLKVEMNINGYYLHDKLRYERLLKRYKSSD